jgi:hypothetical protein
VQHKEQNAQIELLSKMALQGGGYSWNAFPISDSSAEDPNFYISQPMETERREALAAARRRDNAMLVNPYENPRVKTEEQSGVGPRTPYRVPAGVVPASKGENLTARLKPGPRTFRENFGSGEGQKLLAQLDKLARRMEKCKRSGDKQTEAEHEAWVRERDRQESTRVASDRGTAFDVSPIMPLENEVLQHWHGWLYGKIDNQYSQRRNLDRLKEFLRRVKGGRKFGDLHWKDKEELAEIMRCMVEAEERAEAGKTAA